MSDVYIDGEPLDSDKPFALPPGNGQPVVPAIQQFLSILNAATKVYKNPDEAVRHNRENARAMRRDIAIMEPLRSRQLATAALPWSLEPEDGRDPKQQEVCKTLTRIINDIPYFLQYKMSLLEAIFFGRWAVQNRYQWQYKKGQKYLCIKNWEPVHGDTLEFFWGDDSVGLLVNPTYFGPGTNELTTVQTDVTRAHKLTQQEREAFVIHIGEFQAGDFFEPDTSGYVKGVGLRTYLYWTWYLKHQALSWAMEYLERYGVGFTIFYFDRGNSQSEAAVRQAAESEAFKNVILWPRDKDDREAPIQRIEPSLSGLQNLMALIDDYFGRHIKLMIVGQEMTSEKGPSGLGGNLATVHENSFQRIVRYDSECLAETLTKDLLGVLIKYNYPEIDFNVKFKIHLDQKDPKGFLEACKLAVELGVEIDKDDIRNALGIPKPTEDSDVAKAEEPAAPGLGTPPPGAEAPPAAPVAEQQEPLALADVIKHEKGFVESEHPRANDGKFGSGSGGSSGDSGGDGKKKEEPAKGIGPTTKAIAIGGAKYVAHIPVHAYEQVTEVAGKIAEGYKDKGITGAASAPFKHAKEKATKKFKEVEERYGRKAALLMGALYLGSWGLWIANPTLGMMIAPEPSLQIIAVAEAIRYLGKKLKNAKDEEIDIETLIKLVKEFAKDMGEKDISDEELLKNLSRFGIKIEGDKEKNEAAPGGANTFIPDLGKKKPQA